MTFLVATLTGALHERDFLHFLAVGRTLDRATIGGNRQLFQLHAVDHVLALAVTQFRQLTGIVRCGAGSLNDGAKVFRGSRTTLGADVSGETTRCTGGFGDGRVQVYGDRAVGFDRRDHVGDSSVDRVGVRCVRGHVFPHLSGKTTKLTGLFNQMHRVTGLGGFDGCSHAGDTTTDHQDGVVAAFFLLGGGHGGELGFGTTHTDVVRGHFLCGLAHVVFIRANPDDTFTQVGA